MNIKTLGQFIHHRRKELDYTQSLLAQLAGVSRVTLSKLENSDLSELGVSKLFDIFRVLGLNVDVSADGKSISALEALCISSSVGYKRTLSPKSLMKALTSGTFEVRDMPLIATLLDEIPESLLSAAVLQTIQMQHVPAKKVWQHLRNWAVELKSPRSLWY